MASYRRYAVYYVPDDPALARFGASWLGWDIARGEDAAQSETGLPMAEVTATPRKYGFHGTLKPPFRLAEGRSAEELHSAVGELAAGLAPVMLDGLRVASLGHFVALVPERADAGLAALAAACVQQLDPFRAPAPEAELDRRRARGLSPAQEDNLVRWGYPYVLEEFRFHLTLSGALDAAMLDAVKTTAESHLPPLPRPFPITSISLVGERQDGCFEAIHRYALTA